MIRVGDRSRQRYEEAVKDYNDLWKEKKDLQDRINFQSFHSALYSEESALDRLREVSSVMESMRKTWGSAGKNIVDDARDEWRSARRDWMRDTRTKEERDLFHSMAKHLTDEVAAGRAWNIEVKCLEMEPISIKICSGMTVPDLKYQIQLRTGTPMKMPRLIAGSRPMGDSDSLD